MESIEELPTRTSPKSRAYGEAMYETESTPLRVRMIVPLSPTAIQLVSEPFVQQETPRRLENVFTASRCHVRPASVLLIIMPESPTATIVDESDHATERRVVVNPGKRIVVHV